MGVSLGKSHEEEEERSHVALTSVAAMDAFMRIKASTTAPCARAVSAQCRVSMAL